MATSEGTPETTLSAGLPVMSPGLLGGVSSSMSTAWLLVALPAGRISSTGWMVPQIVCEGPATIPHRLQEAFSAYQAMLAGQTAQGSTTALVSVASSSSTWISSVDCSFMFAT